MKTRTIVYLVCMLSVAACTSARIDKQYVRQLKYTQMSNYLYSSGWSTKAQLDEGLSNLKKQVKTAGNTKAGLQKIIISEYLKKELATTAGHIDKLIIALKGYSSTLLMQEFKRNTVPRLMNVFDKYALLLQKKDYSKYISDTTSWSRRYLKLIPPSQRKKSLSFAHFYFENSNRAEAIMTLHMLQLGILQEALVIQKNILKE